MTETSIILEYSIEFVTCSVSCLIPLPSRFYDEIGTPLLSDIRINYTEDSVQYVTQHLFTNYFNGSEIVIAGKLTNKSAESLHVQVTATNNDKSIILETDVPLRHRQLETEKHVRAATAALAGSGRPSAPVTSYRWDVALGAIAEDFVERMWGFLSVKDGLRSRLKSKTSREREEHVNQATNLSMAYNFLTPLTDLVVERPEVLADGTMAPAPTVSPAPSGGDPATNSLLEDNEEERPQKSDQRSTGSSLPSNRAGQFVLLLLNTFTNTKNMLCYTIKLFLSLVDKEGRGPFKKPMRISKTSGLLGF